ncbi:PREDICTED: inhibitor of nuclear factor kappa-B kinase subunit alpha [Gekko japonicus]|uniref:Inhibitor of nuclear factor kappa-B kinase subunit alpha n=1 Tax=Gekko japonicus TaxID=146911 RepID=A0ABM1KNX0_GEKJA|nr:PREDICTED: inhibitor of nuclear factor kappa-B kinase subunit alpha [Gekko japonicus]
MHTFNTKKPYFWETGTKIAIKSCRLELSMKNKDRWCHEIQIMKKLNHPNVVKACDVPEEMNFLVNDVPLLAMQYCSGGDLRKLLNKPENCCGLKESQVLSILSDIGSGIQYLHENRIIHRDLKPENIVLQEEGGKVTHKIIDLGYAKDLDQGTLCTSFVGTLQYLAPELFDNKGAGQIVHILNMTSAKILSFPLHPEESLHSLQCRIESETGIGTISQELLLEMGICLDPRKPASQCIIDGVRGWDSYMVYLFDKSKTIYDGPFASRSLSECVNCIVQDSKIQLPILRLRKIWAEAVHYVMGLKEDYSRLFQGQRAAMLSLLRYNANLTKMKNNMVSASQQLKAKLKFFQQSIHLDLERYSDQMTYGISSEKMLKAWKEMEEKALQCEQAGDIGYLDDQIMALHTEIVELQRSPHARRQGDIMENLEQRAIELYKQLKPRAPDHSYSDSTEMVKIIVHTVQSQDWVLKELYRHLSKLLGCKQKIIDLLPRIEVALSNIKEADNSVMQMQGKRQREIWHLLKIACTQSSAKSASSSVDASPASAWLSQTSPGNALQPLSSMAASRNEAPFSQLIEENLSYLSNFSSMIQDAAGNQNDSVMSLDWSWLK